MSHATALGSVVTCGKPFPGFSSRTEARFGVPIIRKYRYVYTNHGIISWFGIYGVRSPSISPLSRLIYREDARMADDGRFSVSSGQHGANQATKPSQVKHLVLRHEFILSF